MASGKGSADTSKAEATIRSIISESTAALREYGMSKVNNGSATINVEANVKVRDDGSKQTAKNIRDVGSAIKEVEGKKIDIPVSTGASDATSAIKKNLSEVTSSAEEANKAISKIGSSGGSGGKGISGEFGVQVKKALNELETYENKLKSTSNITTNRIKQISKSFSDLNLGSFSFTSLKNELKNVDSEESLATVLTKIRLVRSELEKMSSGTTLSVKNSNLTESITVAINELEAFKNKYSETISKLGMTESFGNIDFSSVKSVTDLNALTERFKAMKDVVEKQYKIDIDVSKVDEAQQKISSLKDTLQTKVLTQSDTIEFKGLNASQLETASETLQTFYDRISNASSMSELKSIESEINNYITSLNTLSTVNKQQAKIEIDTTSLSASKEKVIADIQAIKNSLSDVGNTEFGTKLNTILNGVNASKSVSELNTLKTKLSALRTEISSFNNQAILKINQDQAIAQVNKLQAEISEFKIDLNSVEASGLKNAMSSLENIATGSFSADSLKEFNATVRQARTELELLKNSVPNTLLQTTSNNFETYVESLRRAGNLTDENSQKVSDLRTQLSNVFTTSQLTAFNAELAKFKSEIALANEEAKGFKEFETTISQINANSMNLGEMLQTGAATEFSSTINTILEAYQSLFTEMTTFGPTTTNFDSIQNKASSLNEMFVKLKTSVSEFNNQVNSSISGATSNATSLGNILSLDKISNASTSGIANLREYVKSLKADYESLVAEMQKGVSAARYDEIVSELKELDAEYKQVEATAKKFGVGISNASTLSGIENSISVLKSQVANYDFSAALNIDGMDAKINAFITALKNVDAQSFDSVKSQWVALKSELESAVSANGLTDFNTTLTTVEGNIATLKTALKFDGIADGSTSGIVSLREEIIKLIGKYEELQNKLNSGKISGEEYAKVKKSLAELESQMKSITSNAKLFDGSFSSNAKLGEFESRIESLRQKFIALKETYSGQVQNTAITQMISNLEKSFGNVDAINFGKIAGDVNTLSGAVKNNNTNLANMGNTAATTAGKFSALVGQFSYYLSAVSIFHRITAAIKGVATNVTNLNAAMTGLKRVTNLTNAEYEKFYANAGKVASKIGVSMSDYISSTANFAQLGYNVKDAQTMAQAASTFSLVGNGVDTLDNATSYLTSTIQAYGYVADDATTVVDKIDAAGNNMAITAGGIGEALTRSASALSAAGNTLDESIALISASNAVVQNPESVGTAWKTVALRIRGAKTELEEAGLETDGMVESTSTLREYILQMTGVDIMIDDSTFKSTYEIITEISKVWNSLTDINQAALLEKIAGKRSSNIVSAALTNTDDLIKSMNVTSNADGTAATEYGKMENQIAIQASKAQAAWEEFSSKVMSSDIISFSYSAKTGILGFLTQMIEKSGTATPLVAALAAAFLSFTGDIGIVSNLGNSMAQVTTNAAASSTAMKNASNAANSVSSGMGKATVATRLFSAALNAIVVYAITQGLATFVSYLDKTYNSLGTANKKLEESKDAYSESTETLSELNSELQTTQSRIEELEGMDSLTIIEQDELDTLRNTNTELKRTVELEKELKSIKGETVKNDAVSAYNEYKWQTKTDWKDIAGYTAIQPTNATLTVLGDDIYGYNIGGIDGDTWFDMNKVTRNNGGKGERLIYTREGAINADMAAYQKVTDWENYWYEQMLNESTDSSSYAEYKTKYEKAQKLKAEIGTSLSNELTTLDGYIDSMTGGTGKKISNPVTDQDYEINDAIDFKNQVENTLLLSGNKQASTLISAAKTQYSDEFSEIQSAIISGTELTEETLQENWPDLYQYILDNMGNTDLKDRVIQGINEEFSGIASAAEDAADDTASTYKESAASLYSQLFSVKSGSSKEDEKTAYDYVAEAVDEQNKNGSISFKTYENLIAHNSQLQGSLKMTANGFVLDTAEAQKYVNAQNEIVESQALHYIQQLNEELNSSDISDARRQEILSEISAYQLLINEIRTANGEFSKWNTASSTPNQDANWSSVSGWKDTVVNGVKTGKTGTDDFQAGVEYILGSDWQENVGEGKKYKTKAEAYSDASKLLTRYYGQETESDNWLNFLNDAVDKGAATKDGKQYTWNVDTVSELATAMGTSEDHVRNMLALMETYEIDTIDYTTDLSEADQEKANQYKTYKEASEASANMTADIAAKQTELDGINAQLNDKTSDMSESERSELQAYADSLQTQIDKETAIRDKLETELNDGTYTQTLQEQVESAVAVLEGAKKLDIEVTLTGEGGKILSLIFGGNYDVTTGGSKTQSLTDTYNTVSDVVSTGSNDNSEPSSKIQEDTLLSFFKTNGGKTLGEALYPGYGGAPTSVDTSNVIGANDKAEDLTVNADNVSVDGETDSDSGSDSDDDSEYLVIDYSNVIGANDTPQQQYGNVHEANVYGELGLSTLGETIVSAITGMQQYDPSSRYANGETDVFGNINSDFTGFLSRVTSTLTGINGSNDFSNVSTSDLFKSLFTSAVLTIAQDSQNGGSEQTEQVSPEEIANGITEGVDNIQTNFNNAATTFITALQSAGIIGGADESTESGDTGNVDLQAGGSTTVTADKVVVNGSTSAESGISEITGGGGPRGLFHRPTKPTDVSEEASKSQADYTASSATTNKPTTPVNADVSGDNVVEYTANVNSDSVDSMNNEVKNSAANTDLTYTATEVVKQEVQNTQTGKTKTTTTTVNADTSGAESKINSIAKDQTVDVNANIASAIQKIKSLSNEKPKVNIDGDTSKITSALNAIDGSTITIKMNYITSGVDTTGSNGYASGTGSAPISSTSLVDEEGPELIEHVSKGTYELGTNKGPRFTHIDKGDVVHTAKETKSILARAGGSIRRIGGAFKNGLNTAKTTIGSAFDGGLLGQVLKGVVDITGHTGDGSSGKKKSTKKTTSSSTKKTTTSTKKTSSKTGTLKYDDWKDWVDKLFDWIEIRIARLSQTTTNLINEARHAVELTDKQNKLDQALANVSTQIDTNRQAYTKYLEQADAVAAKLKSDFGFTAEMIEKIKNGAMEISDYSSENKNLSNVISEYKDW